MRNCACSAHREGHVTFCSTISGPDKRSSAAGLWVCCSHDENSWTEGNREDGQASNGDTVNANEKNSQFSRSAISASEQPPFKTVSWPCPSPRSLWTNVTGQSHTFCKASVSAQPDAASCEVFQKCKATSWTISSLLLSWEKIQATVRCISFRAWGWQGLQLCGYREKPPKGKKRVTIIVWQCVSLSPLTSRIHIN